MTNDDMLDLSSLNVADYRRLGLRFNPFPSADIPSETHIITADRQLILDRFKELLSGVVQKNESYVMAIAGDWGSGKTHMLQFFRERVNVQLSQLPDTKAIAIYVQSIGRGFVDIYSSFVESLGRSFFYEFAISFIKRLGLPRLERYLDRALGVEKWVNGHEAQLAPDKYYSTLLRQPGYKQIFDELRSSVSHITNSDVIYGILNLAHPDYSSLAWRWLVGDKLRKAEMDSLSVSKSIEDEGTARDMLNGIISLLKTVNGYKGVVVLIDEVEDFVGLPKSLRNRFLEDLRHFKDENPEGFFLVLALTPSAHDQLMSAPTALSRRLQGYVHELEPFTLKETRELIGRYLNEARLKLSVSEGFKVNPFSDEAVESIQSISSGSPGNVVKLCRFAIEEGRRVGLELIDSSVVSRANTLIEKPA